jgi:transposase
MPYSDDIRKLVIEAIFKKNMTGKEVEAAFGVSPMTQHRWKKQFIETGDVRFSGKYSPGAPPHISTEVFLVYMSNPLNQQKTQREISEEFGESIMTISNMMKKIGFTRKKRLHIPRVRPAETG